MKSFEEITARIKEMYEEGYEDEEIAKELKLPVYTITPVRRMMGLARASKVSPFTESKKLKRIDANEVFNISFNIPTGVLDKLDIDWKNDYEYFVHVSGKRKLEITITQV